jgi:hypothetical protein
MFLELKQSYLTLAENMEWLAANPSKTIRPGAKSPTAQRRKRRDDHPTPANRDNILQSLGAAVILRWNTIPTQLQRELFKDASMIDGAQQAAPVKEALARFLHDHKDDVQKPDVSGQPFAGG